MQNLKLFEDKSVRTIWDEEHEKWYFSVVDVVAVLTESPNPTDYFKNSERETLNYPLSWGQIVPR